MFRDQIYELTKPKMNEYKDDREKFSKSKYDYIIR